MSMDVLLTMMGPMHSNTERNPYALLGVMLTLTACAAVVLLEHTV